LPADVIHIGTIAKKLKRFLQLFLIVEGLQQDSNTRALTQGVGQLASFGFGRGVVEGYIYRYIFLIFLFYPPPLGMPLAIAQPMPHQPAQCVLASNTRANALARNMQGEQEARQYQDSLFI
jgi:hypothetical protein